MEKIIDKSSIIIEENEKLIANILHDIKSPLYSIKIGLQSHLDCELNKDVFETVTDTIGYIENFLLDYNFKKGKYENKIQICNVKEIVYRKIEDFKYIFLNKKICVDIFCEENNYNINSIYIFLSSIIGNLISNMAFHGKENEHGRIDIYKKQNCIIAEFKNNYDSNNTNFSLGLDFCSSLANKCKADLKFVKTKQEVRVNLKIPNLNY